MKTYQIELLEPKAKRLLEELAALKLIKIHEVSDPKQQFKDLLSKFRSTDADPPSLKEITEEVEEVRRKRYEQP